jgi:CheY-like chemotaxis protein
MEDRVRGYAGPRQTVLVVDDNEIQRDLVRDLLTPLGFDVLAAATGRECLALAEQHRPNLVLLDIAMPEMDGWQVAQGLRRLARSRAAIVMLSANAVDQSRLIETERLYDDYLMKPIDLRHLLKKIHALLDIEWLYEPAVEPLPAAAASPLVVPDRDDINELISLGEIGHVRKIADKLTEIENRSPAYADFVAQIRIIIDAFDLKRYAATLEAMRGAHG